MDMKKIGKRIYDTRKEKRMTLQDIADDLGVARSTIQRYEKGLFDNIGLPMLEAIAKSLDVNPSWIIYKSDEKKTQERLNIFSVPGIMPIETKKIPLLGEIACGEPIYATEDFESYVECGAEVKADFALRAKGDSMINARINDGDIVFVRKQPMVNNGEIVVVQIDDEATLKRFYRKDNIITLMAENPTYAPITVVLGEDSNVNILGKAVAFQSDVI